MTQFFYGSTSSGHPSPNSCSSPVLLLNNFFFFVLFFGIMRVFVVALVVLCFVGSCFAVEPACKEGKILLFLRFFFPIVFFFFPLLLSTHLLVCIKLFNNSTSQTAVKIGIETITGFDQLLLSLLQKTLSPFSIFFLIFFFKILFFKYFFFFFFFFNSSFLTQYHNYFCENEKIAGWKSLHVVGSSLLPLQYSSGWIVYVRQQHQWLPPNNV